MQQRVERPGSGDRTPERPGDQTPEPPPVQEPALGMATIAAMVQEAVQGAVHQAVHEAVERLYDPGERGTSQERDQGMPLVNQERARGEVRGPGQGFTTAHGVEAAGPASTAANVSMALRQKIISHKYVDLKALLLPSERPMGTEDRQYLVAEDGKIMLGAAPQREELSVNGWTKAFLRYANIYTQEYPLEAVDMLKYMGMVMDLTSRGLGKAWKEYDESFRKAREMAPQAYPWDHPPHMIWMGAVAAGLSNFQGERRYDGLYRAQNRQGQVFQRSPALGYCRDYNSPAGCGWARCRFRHSCNKCGGAHGANSCSGRQRLRGPAAFGKPNQQAE